MGEGMSDSASKHVLVLLAAACVVACRPTGEPDYDAAPVGPVTACVDARVETFATGRDHAVALAADATHVYWIDAGHLDDAERWTPGAIVRAPVTGGAPEQLISGLTAPGSLVVTADHVYWVDDAGTWRARKDGSDGGTPRAILDAHTASEIVIRGGRIYWRAPGGIGAADLDGANSVVLEASPDTLYLAFTADDSHVYWSTGAAVMRVAVSGGEPEIVAPLIAAQLEVTSTNLYVAADAPDAARVARVALSDNAVTELLTVDGWNPRLSIAGGEVVVAYQASTASGCGIVAQVPSAPGEAPVLATDPGEIAALLVTDRHVWWSSTDAGDVTGTIRRLVR